jgi:hypothetical protein
VGASGAAVSAGLLPRFTLRAAKLASPTVRPPFIHMNINQRPTNNRRSRPRIE